MSEQFSIPTLDRQLLPSKNSCDNSSVQFAIYAGLGNQLFQFAVAHSYRADHDRPVELIIDSIPDPQRPFELLPLLEVCSHGFDMRYANFREERGRGRVLNFVQLLSPKFIRLSGKLLPNAYETTPFNFNLQQIHTNKLNVGYYQHWKYVNRSWDTLGPEIHIVLENQLSSVDLDFDIETCTLIHIRRGDLIQSKNTMGLLNEEYYANALKKLDNESSQSKRIVLTDDVENSKYLADILNVHEIIGPSNLTAWQSLAVMSKAKKLIAANSTLSWWASYVAMRNGAQVVLPDPWFLSWPVKISDSFQFPGSQIAKGHFEND